MSTLQFCTKKQSKLIVYGFIRIITKQFKLFAPYIPILLFELVWSFYYFVTVHIYKGDNEIKINKLLFIKTLNNLKKLWKSKNIVQIKTLNLTYYELLSKHDIRLPFIFKYQYNDDSTFQFEIIFSLYDLFNNNYILGTHQIAIKIKYDYISTEISHPKIQIFLNWNPKIQICNDNNNKPCNEYGFGFGTFFFVGLIDDIQTPVYNIKKCDKTTINDIIKQLSVQNETELLVINADLMMK